MKTNAIRGYVVDRLQYALNPSSVAVIGASRCPGKVGHKVIDGLQKWGYQGKIYPVNPRAEKVAGLKAYPTLREIEEPVDLAFIAVPAHLVKSILEDCVAKEVKIVVIATSAFKEIGRGELQDELTEYCRTNELPLIGAEFQLRLYPLSANAGTGSDDFPIRRQPVGGVRHLAEGSLRHELLRRVRQ